MTSSNPAAISSDTWRPWVLAARPKTLPAAVAPVLVGTAVAIHENGFAPLFAVMALVTALLLQIAANLANDALDSRKGTDTADRLGPTRVTSSGMVPEKAVLTATGLVLMLSVLSGSVLVWRGGWPLLVLGLAAIVCAVAYTGGPFPLGYLGLGEVFVFMFFGPVAVTGSAWVQTLELTPLAVAVSIPIGALATGILVVNNLRDLQTDAASGKRTIAVRIGPRRTRHEYALLILVALASPPMFWLAGWLSWWWLITIATWPLAWFLMQQVYRQRGSSLNQTLAATARLQLFYSILLSASLILS